MIIAVASTRKSKVDAVRAAMGRLAPLLNGDAETRIEESDVDSGVAETPVTIEELVQGARNRSRTLCERYRTEQRHADLFVGLEGGFFSLTDGLGVRTTFLQNWACVFDGERESLAAGGAIEVPDRMATAVMDHGESLAVVIDRVAQGRDIRSNQGTWGILTKDVITRQSSFELAVINALAPWYNKEFYGHEEKNR